MDNPGLLVLVCGLIVMITAVLTFLILVGLDKLRKK